MSPEALKNFGALALKGPNVAEGDPIHKLAAEVAKSGDKNKAKELAKLVNSDPSFCAESIQKGGSEVCQIAVQLLQDAAPQQPAAPNK